MQEGGTLEQPRLQPKTGIDVMLEADNPNEEDGGSPWLHAELRAVLAVPAATQALTMLLGYGCSGWDYAGSMPGSRGATLGLSTWELFTALAVLEVRRPGRPAPAEPPVWAAPVLHRGAPVWVGASPFGLVSPRVFRASVSTGVIANTVPHGVAPALLVTDARGLAGSEGGVVVDGKGQLVAMMAPPLKRTDGTTSALSVCIALAAFSGLLGQNRGSGELQALPACAAFPTEQQVVEEEEEEDEQGAGMPHRLVHKASKAVVAVRVGSLWGSGILVSSTGYVLTNAHILRPSLDSSTQGAVGGAQLVPGCNLRVCFHDQWYSADLVLVSTGVMDVAIVKVRGVDNTPFMTLDPTTPIQQGQRVFAVGHALFTPAYGLVESVTAGLISQVVSVPKYGPVMIQSSVAVHQGNSGGALISADDGRLLGLVTSNARHISGRIIPTLNFSLPVTMLDGVNRLLAEDPKASRMLHLNDPELFDIWNLEPPSFDINLDGDGDASHATPPALQSKL